MGSKKKQRPLFDEKKNKNSSRAKKQTNQVSTRKEINTFALFESAFEHANTGLAILDNQKKIIKCNNTFLGILGYTSSEIIGLQLESIINQNESREDKTQIIKSLQEKTNSFSFEARGIHKNGQILWLKFSINQADFSKGESVFYIVTIEDLTEKKVTEEQIQLSKIRLNEVESIAQIGHYSLDVKTGFWESSESLDQIFGIDNNYTKNVELWQKLLAPSCKKEMTDYLLNEVLLKHNKFDKEYQIISLDTKTTKWVHGRGLLKLNENNEVVSMVGTIQDISKRKTDQLKILKSKNALKKTIRSTIGKSGQEYFDSITESLSQISKADFTFILEKLTSKKAVTKSAYQLNKKITNFSYDLKHSPCENHKGKKSSIILKNAAKIFPQDPMLTKMKIESFVGTPIYNQTAQNIGIIISLFKKPLEDPSFIQSVFEICSANIGSEMQRTRAELQIFENEQILNTIFDNSPFIMMLLDDKAKIVKINKTGSNLLDYSSNFQPNKKVNKSNLCKFNLSNGKFCGKSAACSNCSILNIYNETMESGQHVYKNEIQVKTEWDGKEFLHTFLVSSSRVERSGRHFVLLTMDDITERKLMEQRMHENEITLNKIFDQAPIIMMLINENAEIIKINKEIYKKQLINKQVTTFPTCKEIFNCVASKVENSTTESEMCKNCLIKETIDATLKTGREIFKKEADIITNVGPELKLKTYQISSTLIDKRSSKKVLLTLDDITEQKKTREELKLSKESAVYNEKRYRLLSNLTFEGIFLHQNRKIIDANRTLLKMTGYSYAEIIGQDSMSFLFPAEYESSFKQKMTEDHSHPYETVIIKKNGSQIPVELESRYFNRNNQRIRVAAIRDITDRKILEKKVLQAVIKTEENERARFAQELHDGLGPILSNVQMYFQWLAEEDENKQFVFDKGNTSLKNAFATLHEISNNLSPHILHNFGLLQALNNFIDSLAVKNIKFEVKENIESFRFDQDVEISLYRVLTELINNSLKYSSASLINIKIWLEKQQLSVVYSDNGKGFNPEEIQKTSKGFGMINITNRIKTLHGKINIKSQPEKGILVDIKIMIFKR